MSRTRIVSILVAAVWLWDAPTTRAGGDESPKTQEAAPSAAPGKLVVTVGKSLIIDSPMKIQRISVANGDLIEAVAVNPKEVLINGKAAGETSLIIWQEGGNRLLYDLTVRLSPMRLDAVRQQLARDFPNEDINVTYENETAFVRGTVKDVIAAERVMAMTASLGKSVNLLRVEVPPVEEQILLKVMQGFKKPSVLFATSVHRFSFMPNVRCWGIIPPGCGKSGTVVKISIFIRKVTRL